MGDSSAAAAAAAAAQNYNSYLQNWYFHSCNAAAAQTSPSIAPSLSPSAPNISNSTDSHIMTNGSSNHNHSNHAGATST